MEYQIARCVICPDDLLDGASTLVCKPDMASIASYDPAIKALVISGTVDFTTYFNALPVNKWKLYTGASSFSLRLSLRGDDTTIAIIDLDRKEDGTLCNDVVALVDVPAAQDIREVEFALPDSDGIIGFAIQTKGVVELSSASYYGTFDHEMRDIRIALSTTTFKKEEFIVPNISLVKQAIFADEEWAERFHMFVVDNGRTLDAKVLSNENIDVIANINAGGSGGFARGMMKALDDGSFTHILLMDDDVKVCPESFKRTWTLLALADGRWVDACVNGAMLVMEEPMLQFEDVAFARRGGGYAKIKPDLDMSKSENLLVNETFDYSQYDHMYGAWWYSCIPMAAVKENGLPIPFFVRCDDVEYGIRLGRPYMTMSGIGIWHAGFDGRFRAAVDCYQYARNMLATMSFHPFFDMRVFKLKYHRTFAMLLRKMDYSSAELWLDGLEDYLRGPAYLVGNDGCKLMMDEGAKAEKLLPLSELDEDVENRRIPDEWLRSGTPKGKLAKLFSTIPHDRHWFPSKMLRDKSGMTITGPENHSPWTETAMTKRLLVMSPAGGEGVIRTMDKQRYRQLWKRYRVLAARWRAHGNAVAEEWRGSHGYLSSREFWDRYLGLG